MVAVLAEAVIVGLVVVLVLVLLAEMAEAVIVEVGFEMICVLVEVRMHLDLW